MTKLSKTLDTLHTELAQTLLDKVRSGDAKASDLNVARQFLKDNGRKWNYWNNSYSTITTLIYLQL